MRERERKFYKYFAIIICEIILSRKLFSDCKINFTFFLVTYNSFPSPCNKKQTRIGEINVDRLCGKVPKEPLKFPWKNRVSDSIHSVAYPDCPPSPLPRSSLSRERVIHDWEPIEPSHFPYQTLEKRVYRIGIYNGIRRRRRSGQDTSRT